MNQAQTANVETFKALVARCEHRIAKARARIMLKSAFYGSLVVRLTPVCAPECQTAATDGESFFYSPYFIESLSDDQLQGLLVHEVMHCANGHQWRRGDRDHDTFNVACDFAINPDVLLAGYELPDAGCIDPQYSGLAAEEIYRRICQQQVADSQTPDAGGESETCEDAEVAGIPGFDSEDDDDADDEQDGKGGDGEDGEDGDEEQDGAGCEQDGDEQDGDAEGEGEGNGEGEDGEDGEGEGEGSGDDAGEGEEDGESDAQGNGEGNGEGEQDGTPTVKQTSDPGGCGAFIDSPVPKTREEREELEHEWQEAVVQAAEFEAGRGDIPGNLKRMVNEILHPQESWEEMLRKYFENFAQDDYSFARPDRAGLPHDIYLPSPDGEGCGEIVIGLDTSGSIDDVCFKRFIGVMNDILETVHPSAVHVVHFDSAIQHEVELLDGEEIDTVIHGGGGTDLRLPFVWLDEQVGINPAVVVVFTDMADHLAKLEGHEPNCQTLWVDWNGRFFNEDTNSGGWDGNVQLPFGDYVHVTAED